MPEIKKSPIDWSRCYRFDSKNRTDSAIPTDQENLQTLADHGEMVRSRFWVDGVGICYVADSEKTAIKEMLNWQSKFYKNSKRKPGDVPFALLEISVDKSALHCDIRGLQEDLPELYDPDDYSKSQAFAIEQHSNGEKGIIYDSVRHENGECAAVFTEERLKSDTIKGISLRWDGKTLSKKS